MSDYFKSFEQIAEANGHSHECHEVKTQDGYILQVFRIQPTNSCEFDDGNNSGSRPSDSTVNNSEKKAKKPVVFMQHGLLASADSWVVTDHDSMAPAFKLAEAGYDVWLGNQRGSKYSRRHETLDPDSKDDLKYWDFSFVEMGEYDAPA